MSLKNNIEMVKEELNSEEKFFEKAVMTERFVKKYKNVMIGSLVAVVVVVAANITYESNKQSQIESANKELLILTKDATNAKAIAQLKVASPNLYDVWMYSKAVADKDVAALKELQNSKAPLISDLAKYETAQNTSNTKELNDYASKQNAIYKDLAQVQSAVILMNEGKVDLAQQKLSTISEQSALIKIAKALQHYGVK